MEEFDSLWSYQETMEEMRQKVVYTSLEVERMKMEASDEKRKNKEYVKQLLQLIKMAYQERDEARDHIQKLVHKISPADSPLVKATKTNSSTIESNSLTDNSSPVDSFVSSPEFSNVDSNAIPFLNPPLFSVPGLNNLVPQEVPNFDQASFIIDSLINGKPLPQQGKLLQAVLEAGPLLQTLLVAGPLPRWRNPPQFKPLHIPPVSIKGCEDALVTASNSNHFASSLNSQPYFEISCGSSQMLSPCLGKQMLVSAGAANSNSFVHLDKRQRLQ